MAASRATVQQKSSPGGYREKTSQKQERCRPYEPGGVAAGDSDAPAGDSVVAPGDSVVVAGDSVVAAGDSAAPAAGFSADAGLLGSGVLLSGVLIGSTFSIFCSHAARSAALARMQIYFFIGANLRGHIAVIA